MMVWSRYILAMNIAELREL